MSISTNRGLSTQTAFVLRGLLLIILSILAMGLEPAYGGISWGGQHEEAKTYGRENIESRVKTCASSLTGELQFLNPISVGRALREAIRQAKDKPKTAFFELLAKLNGGADALKKDHPKIYSVLADRGFRVDDGVEFLRRQYEQLFQSADFTVLSDGGAGVEDYEDARIMTNRNQGISGANFTALVLDESFLRITHRFVGELGEADRALKAELKRARAKSRIGSLYNGFSTANKLWPYELIFGDVSLESAIAITGFDPVGKMIAIIRDELPQALASDPRVIKSYFLLLLRQFHDDVEHFQTKVFGLEGKALKKILGEENYDKFRKITDAFPTRISHMYLNIFGVDDKSYEAAFGHLEKLLIAEQGVGNINHQHFRLGYYHVNGAVSVLGISSEGLFDGFRARSGLLKFFAESFAAAYKYVTKKGVEGPVRRSFRQFIRRKKPLLFLKFITGRLKLKDVMGGAAEENFGNSIFDKLLENDSKGFEKLRSWVSSRVNSFRGLSIEQQNVLLRDQVLDEWILWLKNSRTIFHHGSSAKILELIDEKLGIKK